MARWPAHRRPPRSPIRACRKASSSRRRRLSLVSRGWDRDNSRTHLNRKWAPWARLRPYHLALPPRRHNTATGCIHLTGIRMEGRSQVRARVQALLLVRVLALHRVKVSRKVKVRSKTVPPRRCPFRTAACPYLCLAVCRNAQERVSQWARPTACSTRYQVGLLRRPDMRPRRRPANSLNSSRSNHSSNRGPPQLNRDILLSRLLLFLQARRCPDRRKLA